MKNSSHRVAQLLGAVLVALQAIAASEEVLWWRVSDEDDPESWSGVQVTALDGIGVPAASLEYQGKGVNAMRLHVVGDSVDAYLPLVDPDFDLGGQTYGYLPGDFYADVSDYAEASYAFAIELGNWDMDSSTWTALAGSDYLSYSTLKDVRRHIADWDTINAPGAEVTPWSPAYVVPEPSGGILALIGGGLLALGRKRKRRR